MKNQRLKLLIGCLLGLGLLFGVIRLYYSLTDDFRLSNISYSELKMKKEWEMASVSVLQETQALKTLNQPFKYIGKGAQCYAFESEDQQYVLKFFKFKHLKPFWMTEWLPAVGPLKAYKNHSTQRKQRKINSVFSGYALAFQENREETQLLYLHLQPTSHLKQQVKVLDKLGLSHYIDLDSIVFLLQRKGETLATRLRKQLDLQDPIAAQHSIHQILHMYVGEYGRGIYDHDHEVMQNTGFVGDHPFHLDAGKFKKDARAIEKEWYKKDLKHVAWKIDDWIKQHYSLYYASLSAYIASQYQAYTGEPFEVEKIDASQFKHTKH